MIMNAQRRQDIEERLLGAFEVLVGKTAQFSWIRRISILAYAWEGEPLPILHGFPVWAVFPELDGSTWVKWLVKIEVY
jgi:DMSO/TMAO reductase YedYZ molybdopterin-dependent catalytic subunit